jgi:hypothetical protein
MTEQQSEPQPPAEPAHVHRWGILDVWHPEAPAHPRLRSDPITITLVRCTTCDMPMTIELEGHWNLQQLIKNYAKIEHRDGG